MNRKPFRLWIAVVAFAGCMAASLAAAQEPTSGAVAAARDMLAVKGALAFFDPVVPGVVESVKNSFIPTNPNLSRELNDVAVALRKEYESKRTEMLNNVARIYAARFTEQELKDMTAFYKTPLGQKLLREEPVALDESLRSTQDWASTFSDTVMARFRLEMRKKGHTL
jgi:hypothetical protein